MVLSAYYVESVCKCQEKEKRPQDRGWLSMVDIHDTGKDQHHKLTLNATKEEMLIPHEDFWMLKQYCGIFLRLDGKDGMWGIPVEFGKEQVG